MIQPFIEALYSSGDMRHMILRDTFSDNCILVDHGILQGSVKCKDLLFFRFEESPLFRRLSVISTFYQTLDNSSGNAANFRTLPIQSSISPSGVFMMLPPCGSKRDFH